MHFRFFEMSEMAAEEVAAQQKERDALQAGWAVFGRWEKLGLENLELRTRRLNGNFDKLYRGTIIEGFQTLMVNLFL